LIPTCLQLPLPYQRFESRRLLHDGFKTGAAAGALKRVQMRLQPINVTVSQSHLNGLKLARKLFKKQVYHDMQVGSSARLERRGSTGTPLAQPVHSGDNAG